MIDPVSFYNNQLDQFEQGKYQILRNLKFFPWSRLLFLVVTIALIYFYAKTGSIGLLLFAILSFSGFLASGWLDLKWKRKINDLDTRIAISKKEIDAIRGDYSGFEPGTEFINETHAYTHDLDIFGAGSLFQYLNRCSTLFGKRRLAEFLSNGYNFRHEVSQRQEAIKELSVKIDFRQKIQSLFVEKNTGNNDITGLLKWMNEDAPGGSNRENSNKGRKRRFVRFLIFALPAITLATILLASAGFIHYRYPVGLFMLQIIFVFGFEKYRQKIHHAISSHFKTLRKYSEALLLIEQESFTSQFSIVLQKRLKSTGHEPPSVVIRRLSKLLNWMDTNLNVFAYLFLNGLFMFSIHLLFAVEKWRNKYRVMIPRWFEVLAEFDALSGLAAFSFNNPEFVFPEISDHDFLLQAEELGHPLILKEECVTNSIEIKGWKQFLIVTGANMSGKSTFLRTIGTNFILAMTGAPVFAKKFTFTPIEIHSSIRNNDSLVKGESYFYAELKQLKEIIEELKSGRKILILLDEILKGTNSSDKQSGSIALIKQLLNYDVIGVFATHDVELAKLISSYPDNIKNYCFEIAFDGDKMEIDYNLLPGVCKNLNASFLMRKMGIVVN